MRKRSYLILLIILFSAKLFCQNISAYVDKNGSFYVFDNGVATLCESFPPVSYKIGGNCVAYIDNSSNFKIYYNGKVTLPFGNNIIDNYTVTHNLVLFTIRRMLLVFDKGKTDTLVQYNAYNYQVNDSLVVFQDGSTKSLQVYYNGKIDTLIKPFSDLSGYYYDFQKQVYTYKYLIGKNIVAFISNLDLKVFFQNNIYTLANLPQSKINNPYSYPITTYNSFQVGNNIVSFIDPITKMFSAFYKGLNYDLSDKRIYQFQTGDDLVAYTDSLGLHAFYAGKEYDLVPATTDFGFKPVYFSVKDNVLIYYIPGHLKVFNNGTITDVYDRMLTQYKIDNNLLAWIDMQNNLNALYNGKIYTLSTFIKPVDYIISKNTIWFKVAPNEDHVFFKGKIY